MAIPGLKPKLEVRAKVRIGEKRKAKSGTEYPAAVDYFRCDDPLFAELAGENPSKLQISFLHESPSDAFSTGLEWWRGKQLTCYTKGDGKALRVDSMVRADDTVLRTGVGRERTEIVCPGRECPLFGKKDCKPMGRLMFALAGDAAANVFQIDTHAWNSIERLEGALGKAAMRGDLRGRTFELTVAFESKGTSRFPVLSLTEVGVSEEAINTAESIIAAEQTQGDNRAKLIAAIRARGKDPKDPVVVEWVKKHGVDKALELLTRTAA